MPLCPLLAATAAEPAGRGRARESFNFTLKAIRAERVQIVNGVASAALVHGSQKMMRLAALPHAASYLLST
jgi:hypothetical protein